MQTNSKLAVICPDNININAIFRKVALVVKRILVLLTNFLQLLMNSSYFSRNNLFDWVHFFTSIVEFRIPLLKNFVKSASHKYLNIIIFISTFFVNSCEQFTINRITKIQTKDAVISNQTFILKGTIVDIGERGITTYGHVWSTNINPELSNSFKTEFYNPEVPKIFESTITDLTANTVYYYRVYTTDASTIYYGEVLSFNTAQLSTISVNTEVPVISSSTSVTIKGAVSEIKSINVLEYGHCWSVSPLPTINNKKVSNSILKNDTTFTSTITNLFADTKYYVRAFGKLDENTIFYGEEQSFIIPDLKISTDTFSYISTGNASLQGILISLSVSPIKDHGHCWSTTTSNPNINNEKISLGPASSTGSFFSNFNGLVNGKTYYYRAYAITENTVKYGVVKKIDY